MRMHKEAPSREKPARLQPIGDRIEQIAEREPCDERREDGAHHIDDADDDGDRHRP